MPDEEAMMFQLGAFEPTEAKRLLPQLEAAGIPFEIEADNSALLQPGRSAALALGMYPAGSKIVIFVPEATADRAQQLAASV